MLLYYLIYSHFVKIVDMYYFITLTIKIIYKRETKSPETPEKLKRNQLKIAQSNAETAFRL